MKKKCKVVMLPKINDYILKGDLLLSDIGDLSIQTFEIGTYVNKKPQYIYFISDEEIKDGFYYKPTDKSIRPYHYTTEPLNQHPGGRMKVIASTDMSLGLPIIPQSFIEQYIAVNGKIDEVSLKMIENWAQRHSIGKWDDCEQVLKLTPDNEVIVFIPEKKKQWSEESFNKVMDEPSLGLNEEALIEEMRKSIIANKIMKVTKDFSPIPVVVDKELEEAAKSYEQQNSYSINPKTGFMEPNTNIQDSFKSGAQWKAQQTANETIEFLKWIETECAIKNGRVMHGLQSVPSSHKQLYKIWLQNKK